MLRLFFDKNDLCDCRLKVMFLMIFVMFFFWICDLCFVNILSLDIGMILLQFWRVIKYFWIFLCFERFVRMYVRQLQLVFLLYVLFWFLMKRFMSWLRMVLLDLRVFGVFCFLFKIFFSLFDLVRLVSNMVIRFVFGFLGFYVDQYLLVMVNV